MRMRLSGGYVNFPKVFEICQDSHRIGANVSGTSRIHAAELRNRAAGAMAAWQLISAWFSRQE